VVRDALRRRCSDPSARRLQATHTAVRPWFAQSPRRCAAQCKVELYGHRRLCCTEAAGVRRANSLFVTFTSLVAEMRLTHFSTEESLADHQVGNSRGSSSGRSASRCDCKCLAALICQDLHLLGEWRIERNNDLSHELDCWRRRHRDNLYRKPADGNARQLRLHAASRTFGAQPPSSSQPSCARRLRFRRESSLRTEALLMTLPD
jgi:hypothetical protein